MQAPRLLLGVCLALASCVDEEPIPEESFATEGVYPEGSREARAAVAFLNDAATDRARLRAAGVTSNTTAKAVLGRRDGADGTRGTQDDAPFATLGEVDAVKGVGPATLRKLAAYAVGGGFGNERGIHHGVYFTETQADRTLTLVNTVSADVLDTATSVDSRALATIESARPILSLAQLASLSRVKVSALRLLREHADRELGPTLCNHEEPCPSGLFCTGGSDSPGHCVDTSVDGAGLECSSEGICAAGLVCAGRGADFAGICNPSWMRGEFVDEGTGSVPDGPDGGVGVSVQALGLATVPTDAIVRVLIDHPRPQDLALTLENTSGTVVSVWDAGQGPLPRAPDGIPVQVPGDESANGLWTLTVLDTVEGEQGTLSLFTIELTSRFD